MASPPFRFKRFLVNQEGVAHPVGTDSVLLGAWADVDGASRVLDIGTGTGIVALMLAQRAEHTPEIQIGGLELHQDSCKCAQRNFAASPWAGRLSVIGQSIQSFAQNGGLEYDLIVSNPPFFSETTVSPDQNRRLGRIAKSLTLRELLDAAARLLAPGGRFCLILPPAEGRHLCEWGAQQGLYFTRETQVYTRKGKSCERLLLQFERSPYPIQRTRLHLYEKEEHWSDEFRDLTKDFYLHF